MDILYTLTNLRTSTEKEILEEADLGRHVYSINDRFIRHFYACVMNLLQKVDTLKGKRGDATSEGIQFEL